MKCVEVLTHEAYPFLHGFNERTFFNERDTENPEIRDMFKALGIIESFGVGIDEAKRAMEGNSSPALLTLLLKTMK